MALKAVHVSDVPSLDNVTEPGDISYPKDYTTTLINEFWDGSERKESAGKPSGSFMVIGHRGSGMNKVLSPDKRFEAIRENTIMSFNSAGKNGVGFIEFDVQVTKDDHAVIFHDDFIITEDDGIVIQKRIGELTLEEFLSYGYQRDGQKAGKPLFRKAQDGQILKWNVSVDDCLCTLQQAFEKVDPSIGFNIELKFDDHIQYPQEELQRIIQIIIRNVFGNANGRQIFFSSFHPDAAQIARKEQNIYPVFFLTIGGVHTFKDFRRNSLDAAVEVCLTGGLQGIVSEVKAIFQNPGAISRVKESNLCLFSYGQLNNVSEAVYIQNLIGVDGVIVDFVQEIAAAVAEFTGRGISTDMQDDNQHVPQLNSVQNQNQRQQPNSPPSFSPRELSFILKLIPQLIQN